MWLLHLVCLDSPSAVFYILFFIDLGCLWVGLLHLKLVVIGARRMFSVISRACSGVGAILRINGSGLMRYSLERSSLNASVISIKSGSIQLDCYYFANCLLGFCRMFYCFVFLEINSNFCHLLLKCAHGHHQSSFISNLLVKSHYLYRRQHLRFLYWLKQSFIHLSLALNLQQGLCLTCLINEFWPRYYASLSCDPLREGLKIRFLIKRFGLASLLVWYDQIN